MSRVTDELEKSRAARYADLRTWLETLRESKSAPSRSFLELEGSIKVGPGSVSEDIRKARELFERS